MLDKEDLQVVGAFMPYYQNAEVSIQAAGKGIHVMSEKPAATTLKDLERLESVIRSNGIRYSILLAMRAMPIFLAAREAVQQGLIGEPVLLYSRKSYKWGTERPVYYRERRTYGGTIPWVGIHCIDYMRWVSGLEYKRVVAHHGNKAHPAYLECEDHAGLLFTLSNMGTAVAHLDFLRPEAAPTHGDDRLRIAGKEGVLEVVDNEERVSLMTSKGKSGNLPLPPPVDFFGSFVAELRGEGTHLVSNQEAISITRVCLKARDAADRGEWVSL
jgi:predicted dehydrogenase